MKKNLSGPLSALARFLSLGGLSLCFLLVPWAQGQQVTRVGNILTITRNNPALAAIPPEANGAIDVATTQSTSFALMPDGTVVAWGSDEYGLVTDAKYVRGAKKIVAGRNHAVALLENGTLYSWGSNYYNIQATAVSIENAVDVVAASESTGVLKSNGDAVVWGYLPSAPTTFKDVKKLEMSHYYYEWGTPICILYFNSGAIQFYSQINISGGIDANKPNDLSKAVSVSHWQGNMMAIQSDSKIKIWAIRGEGKDTEWLKSQIASIDDAYKVDSNQYMVSILRNTGATFQLGMDGMPVFITDPDVRLIDQAIGENHLLGLFPDKTSGPIIKPFPSTLIVETGQPISVGPQVLLGDSFQWSKDREELLGPVNAQTGRMLNITSALVSDSGVYINKITGNGKTVTSPPINVIVREAGSPAIAVDGESIMYRYPDSLAIKRAGSANIAITTTAMGEDKIYYTLDGTQPSWLSSEAYIAPIVVSQTATLRVVVYTDDQWLVPVYSSPIEISIAPAYLLTINQSVGGKSTVAPLKASYFSGDTVTLKAYPDVGYRFVGWSNGNGTDSTLNLTISANTSIQPLFEPIDSFAVSGMDSLIEGFKVRIVKPATARLITSVADAESVLDTNPDNLGQNELKISNVINFRSPNGNSWPINDNKTTLPGLKWEDSSVVEISGYTEIKSPGLYTLLERFK